MNIPLMAPNFSDLVSRARHHVSNIRKHKNLRDEALFDIGCYISELQIGSTVTLSDGRSSRAPSDASPTAICSMVFTKEGMQVSTLLEPAVCAQHTLLLQFFKEPCTYMLQTQTLAEIIGLNGNVKVAEQFHAGALKWAKKIMQDKGYTAGNREEAARAALILAHEKWPSEKMIGGVLTGKKRLPGEPRYMPKFHWPQVAWYSLWEVRA